MHGLHAATSKVENSAQVLSCQLKFVHGSTNLEEGGVHVDPVAADVDGHGQLEEDGC